MAGPRDNPFPSLDHRFRGRLLSGLSLRHELQPGLGITVLVSGFSAALRISPQSSRKVVGLHRPGGSGSIVFGGGSRDPLLVSTDDIRN